MRDELMGWAKTKLRDATIDRFHRAYYDSPESWPKNQFLGYPILQCPFDLQVYQELIHRTRPAFIVQTGVAGGGSLLYFATMLDLVAAPSSAVVIGVDVALSEKARTLKHPRIRMIEGSSTDKSVLDRIAAHLPAPGGMVVLDSDHSERHVSDELRAYHGWVAVGGYLVVEDTNINDHPVLPTFGPGPHEAVERFLGEQPGFVRDDQLWQRNLFSFHQGGWLRRAS